MLKIEDNPLLFQNVIFDTALQDILFGKINQIISIVQLLNIKIEVNFSNFM